MALRRLQALIKNVRKDRVKSHRQRQRLNNRKALSERLEDRRMLAAELLAIRPDAGALLKSGDTLTTIPSEFNLLFGGGADIRESTIARAVTLTRGGPDGVLGTSDDVAVRLGYVGLVNPSDTDAANLQHIVLRPASSASSNPSNPNLSAAQNLLYASSQLPDDNYRIQILGAGANRLTDNQNQPFNNGVNVITDFRIDRGAQVVAVVPQPVSRNTQRVQNTASGGTFTLTFKGQTTTPIPFDDSAANVQTAIRALTNISTGDVTVTKIGTKTWDVNFQGQFAGEQVPAFTINSSLLTGGAGTIVRRTNLSQASDQIVVYFDSQRLNDAEVKNPKFYRLFNTSSTLTIDDDQVSLPQTVTYDPVDNSVVLIFPNAIPEGNYRLDIGESGGDDSTLANALVVGSLSNQNPFVTNRFLGDVEGNAAANTDNDRLQVTLQAGAILTVATTPVATGVPATELSLRSRLLDSAGVPIASASATVTTAAGVAGTFTYTIVTAGNYYIETTSANTNTGAYRIRASVAASPLVVVDANTTVGTATALGTIGAAGVTVSSQIEPQSIPLPPLPGGEDEPGHRDIQREQYTGSRGTTPVVPQDIKTIEYYFPLVIGTDTSGVSYLNLISITEKQIVRDILENYARLSGFEFIENQSTGAVAGALPIGKGDLRSLDPTIGPNSGVAGLGGASGVVLNGTTFNQANRFYGDAFTTTMYHELGHALGLGHSYDVPSVQGAGVQNDVLPGDVDIVNLQRIAPPNSTDIDMYAFTLGQAGRFSAETIAERLPTPSLLNSVLTLYRKTPGGTINDIQLVARNDQYYGADAFIDLDLIAGDYYIGVSSTGNSQYDPRVADSGFGGTTSGAYNLKLVFKADRSDSLRDVSGTAIDGSGHGTPGGTYSFWFQASDQSTSIYVDKQNDTTANVVDGTGSLASPYDTIDFALRQAGNRIVVPQNATIANLNGQSFTVDDGIKTPVTFTFGTVGANPLDLTGAVGAAAIAIKIRDAILAAKTTPIATPRLSASVSASVTAGSRIVQIGGIDNLDISLSSSLVNTPNLVRIVGNTGADQNIDTIADNKPYLIGISTAGTTLADGGEFSVPQGVTVMIDAGALIKMRKANLDVGSSSANISRSSGAIQVLGTPKNSVFLRSYFDNTAGGNSAGVAPAPNSGDFGGIVLRDDSDLEANGIYLNYINHVDIKNGGGKVFVDATELPFSAIYITNARPTISFNKISDSDTAAVSASPDSFDDSNGRIGPDIHGNYLSNNSIDGLFVRIDTPLGSNITKLNVSGRFDDTDIAHVLSESLIIAGGSGGPVRTAAGVLTARSAGRLEIDPGVVVKLNKARIQVERGAGTLIAEGTVDRPVVFTSLTDNRYGGSGSFNNNRNTGTLPVAGSWGGLFFGEATAGSIDHAIITYGGGTSTTEIGDVAFAAIEIHQADVRVTNSLLNRNASGAATGTRNGRGTNTAATIYIRGAQPVLVNNTITNNAGAAVSINANSLNYENVRDQGRATGIVQTFDQFADNSGPLVRLNRLDGNATNGIVVRGEELTTESVWDDTDIVHVLQSEIIVDNLHTYGGLTLQSSNSQSLVVKLSGANAGFTASGTAVEIDDRVGGTVHVLGQPGFPVVLTSINDCSVGAGFSPTGLPQNDTIESGGCVVVQNNAKVVDIVILLDDTGSFTASGATLATVFPQIVTQLGLALTGTDLAFSIARFEDYAATAAGTDRPFILNQPLISTTTPNFNTIIDAALNRISPGGGGTIPESAIEGLWQIATGVGFDGNADGDTVDSGAAGLVSTQVTPGAGGDVPAYSTFTPDPTGPVVAASGTLGGVGFRANADQKIIILATDANFTYQDDGLAQYTGVGGVTVPATAFTAGGAGLTTPGGLGAQIQTTVNRLVADGIKVIGLGTGPLSQTPLEALATLTGATDASGSPLFFTIQPDNAALITTGVVNAITGSLGITNPAAAGDWRGLLFDEFSNDRNVAVVRELENPLTNKKDVNSNPTLSQSIGTLAPNQKSGDENRRLGFQIDGFISPDDPHDVDVYSFKGTGGTEVWLDIDRTDPTLDSIVEVVNAAGTVLARSIRSGDTSLAGTLNASDLTKNALVGGDYYTQNFRDAGMRYTLPGSGEGTYFVRVRSNPVTAGSITSTTGDSRGKYQLQIRLQQTDEFPGSTVQYADIRFATTGIDVRGLPAHSPLVGEAGELPAANDSFDQAQTLVNLLQTDAAAIGISGNLSDANDADWYQFDLTQTGVQVIPTVNSAPGTMAVVFDLDYADQAVSADTTIAVYNQNRQLVYVGRESNIKDDQRVTGDLGISDLSRGSLGKKDPYIGPIHLTPGLPGAPQRYYVAVMSDHQLPTALTGVFAAVPAGTGGAANALVRLEPVNSVVRVVEDHVGLQGYSSRGVPIVPSTPNGLFDISTGVIASATGVNSNVTPFKLQNVGLYFATDVAGAAGNLGVNDSLYTVDPFRAGQYLTRVTNSIVTGGFDDVQDIIVRSDGRMFGYQRLSPVAGVASVGALVEINPETGVATLVGNDNIQDEAVTPNRSFFAINIPTRTEQFTTSNEVDALTFQRLNATTTLGTTPDYNLYYSVRETNSDFGPNSKLYRARPTGDATPTLNGAPTKYGVLGDIQPAGITYATSFFNVSDNAAPPIISQILLESKVPGTAGNLTRVNISVGRGGVAAAAITSVVGQTINLLITQTPLDPTAVITGGPTAAQIVDAINTDTNASRLVTAIIGGDGLGGNGSNATVSFNEPNPGTIALAGGSQGASAPLLGNVTGLSFGNFDGSGNLFGVTNRGEFLTIDSDTGLVINRIDTANVIGIPTLNFQGLSLGPQNVENGKYANTLFAVTSTGQLIAFDGTGKGVIVFDSGNEAQLLTVTPTAVAAKIDDYFTLTFDSGGALGRLTTAPISALAPSTISINEQQRLNTTASSGTFTLSFVDDHGAISSPSALVTAGAGTIIVESVTGFPAAPFDIRIENEEMRVTAVNAATRTFTVARGANGTTAVQHPDTSTVFELLTARFNGVSTSLTANIDNVPTTTTLTVADASVFPTNFPFFIRIEAEEMRVDAVNVAAKQLTVVRAQNSTTIAAHNSGIAVNSILTLLNSSQLSADVADLVTTTINVVDASVFPTTFPFFIRVDDEEMRINAGGVNLATNQLTVQRGQNGITPTTHGTGRTVQVISDQVTVSSTVPFPATPSLLTPFNIRIDNEDMRVVGRTGNTFSVHRGVNRTALVPHNTPQTTVYKIDTTVQIPFNATAAQIQTALQNLPSIGVGNVTVAAGPLGAVTPATVTFIGALAATNVQPLTGDFTRLGSFDETQQITLNGTVNSGTFQLRFNNGTITSTTGNIAFNATAATVQAALEALPSIGNGNVTVTGGALPGAFLTVTFTNDLRGKDLNPITVVNNNLVFNERQRLQLNGGPTGGSLSLSLTDATNGITVNTGQIPFNANTAAITAAIIAGSSGATPLTAANILVTGNLPGAVTIEFRGNLASNNTIPLFTLVTNNLTGGSTPTPVISLIAAPTSTTITTPTNGQLPISILSPIDGIRSVEDSLVALASINATDVRSSGAINVAGVPGITVNFIGAYAGVNVAQMDVDNFLSSRFGTGALANIVTAGTVGDNLADSVLLNVSGINVNGQNAVGLAFSPLDFNLWHPTTRRGTDAGHGITNPTDGSRDPVNVTANLNIANGSSRTLDQSQGGVSWQFGFEPWLQTQTTTSLSYLTYNPAVNAQFGIRSTAIHADLSSNPNITGTGVAGTAGTLSTYNFPGGALGSLTTKSFSLAAGDGADRPTLYINYFLDTENNPGSSINSDVTNPFADSARIWASRNGGATWELLATNNSQLSDQNPNNGANTAELPGFLSHLSDAGQNSATPRAQTQQIVQELFDNSNQWRQARVDLSSLVDPLNVTNITLRIDFSTAGAMNDTTLGTVDANFGEFATTGPTPRSIRSLDNLHEGFYIDDVIVGYAERGESVTNAVADPSITDLFAAGARTQDNDPSANPDILNGPYQLEIRRTGEYETILPDTQNTVISVTYDTNDSHTLENTTSASVTFEGALPSAFTAPVTATAVPLINRPAGQIVPWGLSVGSANAFVGANSFVSGATSLLTPVSVLKATPATLGSSVTGAGVIRFALRVQSSTGLPSDADGFRFYINGVPQDLGVGQTENPAPSPILAAGSQPYRIFEFPFGSVSATGVTEFLWAYDAQLTNNFSGRAFIDNVELLQGATGLLADRNRDRAQGIFIIDSNFITGSSVRGINVEPGTAQGNGSVPHPGSIINFPQQNAERLVPGAVIQNNVIVGSGTGIRFAGETDPNPQKPVPFGRIVNNTLVGTGSQSGIGIDIVGISSPTVLNNLLTNLASGINNGSTAAANGSTAPIISSNFFQNNADNGAIGTASLSGGVTGSPFVDAAKRNYYLISTSTALDSSQNVEQERGNHKTFIQELGIPDSPINAPDRDVYGQLRVDSSAASSGGGSSVFKDRGAVDRSDKDAPYAKLLNPVDNDALNQDRDPNDTVVYLTSPLIENFSILLGDGRDPNSPFEGTGINPLTVDDPFVAATAVSAVTIVHNTTLLQQGVDYNLGYNSLTGVLLLTPLSTLWEPTGVYTITLNNAVGNNPIADLAGNVLRSNQLDGTTKFFILMPDVRLDFGDAPDSFKTLITSNGARHTIETGATPRLGNTIDSEDSSTIVTAGDDVRQPITIAGSPLFVPTATSNGFQVSVSALPAGGETLTITIGANKATFELVATGSAPQRGNLAVPVIIGGATADTQSTIATKLSAAINTKLVQAGGAATVSATTNAINIATFDDEDGVGVGSFTSSATATPPLTNYIVFTRNGGPASATNLITGFLNPQDQIGTSVNIYADAPGFLDAWIDYNNDGAFGVSERIIGTKSVPVVAGVNPLTIVTPANTPDNKVWARFRISTNGGLGPSELAIGGEVEDYLVEIHNVALFQPVNDALNVLEDNVLKIKTDATSPLLTNEVTGANDPLTTGEFLPRRVIVDKLPTIGTLTVDPTDANQIIYKPADDFYGSVEFTYWVSTQPGLGPFLATGVTKPANVTLATVTIVVKPVNDQPLAKDHSFQTLEETSKTILASDLLAGATADETPLYPSPTAAYPWDETNQTFTISSITIGTGATATTLTNSQNGVAGEHGTFDVVFASAGVLTSVKFTPSLDFNHDNPRTAGSSTFETFTFIVTDSGLSRDPITDLNIPNDGVGSSNPLSAVARTASIDVNPINDTPIAANDFISEHNATWLAFPGGGAIPTEDTPLTIPTGYLLQNDVNARASAGDELANINDAKALVTGVSTTSAGVPGVSAFSALGGMVTLSGTTITYTPLANTYGLDTFVYTISDAGINFDAFGARIVPDVPLKSTATVTILVKPINDVPIAQNRSFTLAEKKELNDVTGALNPSTTDGTKTITATDLLQIGSANPARPSAFFTVPSPAIDENEQKLRVVGFGLPGDTTPVIDAKTLTYVGGLATSTLATARGSLKLNFQLDLNVPGTGALTSLVYTPNVDYNLNFAATTDPFVYFVEDFGEITVPGANSVGEPAKSVGHGSLRALATVTMTVTPVNDPPIFFIPNQVIDIQERDDSGQTDIPGAVTNIFPSAASAVDERAVPAGQTGQTVSFKIVDYYPRDLFDSEPEISPSTSSTPGTLSVFPKKDAVGKAVIIFDAFDELTAGGTFLSQSLRGTITVNIRPVNDAPGLSAVAGTSDPSGTTDNNWSVDAAGQITYTLREDNLNASAVGSPFVMDLHKTNGRIGLLDPFTVGPTVGLDANEENSTEGGLQSLRIINVDPQTAQGVTLAVTRVNGYVTQIKYTPPPNYNSVQGANDSFNYTFEDSSIAGETFDFTTNKLKPDRIEGSGRVEFILNPINDAPQFTGAANVNVTEDSTTTAIVGQTILAKFVNDITAGPITAFDENIGATRQIVHFEITADPTNPSNLFSVPPAVDADGTLSFTTVANANGSAKFTIVAKDDSKDVNLPHINTSLAKTFTITVAGENDSPSFTSGITTVTVAEDSGLYNVSSPYATQIVAGPPDEIAAGQTVHFDVTVPAAAQSLFLVQPKISSPTTSNPGGFLTFTPAKDAVGTVVISIVAVDNLNARSAPASLTITITEVNDAPVAKDFTIQSDEDNASKLTKADFFRLAIDPDVTTNPNELLKITDLAVVSTSGATISVNSDGDVIYDPRSAAVLQALRPGQTKDDTFTYRLKDAANAQSNIATVTVTVAGRNDAPVTRNDTAVLLSQTSILRPLLNDTDIDGTIEVASIIITDQPTHGALSVKSDGTLTYTPQAGYRGLDTIRYTVGDNLGQQSEQALISIDVAPAPVPTADSSGAFVGDTATVTVTDDVDPLGTLDLTSIVIVRLPANGNAIPQSDGTIFYKANAGFVGTDSFDFTIKDTAGRTSAPVTVTVNTVDSRLENPREASDVNASGNTTTLDALLVLNRLSRNVREGNGSSIPVKDTDRGPNYYDVDGNKTVALVDALRVLNFLSRNRRGSSGEGESLLPLAAPEFKSVSLIDSLHTVSEPVSTISFAPVDVAQVAADMRLPSDDAVMLLASDVTDKDEAETATSDRLEAMDSAWSDFSKL